MFCVPCTLLLLTKMTEESTGRFYPCLIIKFVVNLLLAQCWRKLKHEGRDSKMWKIVNKLVTMEAMARKHRIALKPYSAFCLVAAPQVEVDSRIKKYHTAIVGYYILPPPPNSAVDMALVISSCSYFCFMKRFRIAYTHVLVSRTESGTGGCHACSRRFKTNFFSSPLDHCLDIFR